MVGEKAVARGDGNRPGVRFEIAGRENRPGGRPAFAADSMARLTAPLRTSGSR